MTLDADRNARIDAELGPLRTALQHRLVDEYRGRLYR